MSSVVERIGLLLVWVVAVAVAAGSPQFVRNEGPPCLALSVLAVSNIDKKRENRRHWSSRRRETTDMTKRANQKKTATASRPASKTRPGGKERRRFWLTYPGSLITRPVIWQLSQKFQVVFNVRQASVTDEIGIMCLELEGLREEIKAAIRWLEKQGVKVEPVEINVIES